ncbi:potassium channel protein [Enterovibrio norvegicus FF-33]|uniref:ion channel n=1 Tax=Enterovibrio TaxID=188143 RepID=UPI00031A3893|nr:ion channel [Enterovibrio norvegicus]OEE67323.1 potassium channel protein [Enterovibrio norvegicus FF-33]OEE73958.1 potassium channel protein [Enterovibrio norvegicus FF-162]
MTKWYMVRRWITSQFQHLSGKHVAVAVLAYAALSWVLLKAAGEQELTTPIVDFVYYLLVTASTVGYGDMSPQTDAGKWVAALFVIPCGLGIFAIGVGRLAGIAIQFWRKGLTGKRSVDVSDHILILGWNESRTLHLIDMLLHEEKNKRPIVLCVRVDIENPLPKDIDFVRTTSFTDETAMARAGVKDASCIIIDNPEDDITFAAALFCASKNPDAHILAYFQDEVLSNLLKTHCPKAECIPSVSVEMMAKSALDPGSSELHHELLNTRKGMTQYAVSYPADAKYTTVNALFLSMKEKHDATLIGIRRDSNVQLNPPLDAEVIPNDLLFYIADERVTDFSWEH